MVKYKWSMSGYGENFMKLDNKFCVSCDGDWKIKRFLYHELNEEVYEYRMNDKSEVAVEESL